jgi:hypothetical protein
MGAWVSLITFVGTWLAELLLEEVDPLRAEDGLPPTNGSYQGAEAVADPDWDCGQKRGTKKRSDG